MIVFPISKVNSLRTRAAKACRVPDEGPDGWSKSEVDPMKLLAVFKSLKIKSGLILRAFQFRVDGNGNGVIWAMPTDAFMPEPDDCPILEDDFLCPPKPLHALDDLMEAVEGDGTPWSYLSGSLFFREATEFGAMWHGLNWSTHTILGVDPWHPDPSAKNRRISEAFAWSTADEWQWNTSRPELWEPSFEQIGDTISIRFFTFSGLRKNAIYRWTDTFKVGSYTFETNKEVVAEGGGGYFF